MISKAKISEIKKLAQKKFREESGLFIVEGTKSVTDLLLSQLVVEEVFATSHWLAAHPLPQSIRCAEVSPGELERMSCLTTPQEVLATVRIPHFDPNTIDDRDAVIALDGIRDPGNLGTIIRTADWFGFKQVVCSPDCVEFTNPKTIQATMGSFCRMRVFSTDLPDFLKEKDCSILGTFMNGEPIETVKFNRNDILVIGNESNGISRAVEALVSRRIHIPSFETSPTHAESLNASIAAAVVMYQYRLRIQ